MELTDKQRGVLHALKTAGGSLPTKGSTLIDRQTLFGLVHAGLVTHDSRHGGTGAVTITPEGLRILSAP